VHRHSPRPFHDLNSATNPIRLLQEQTCDYVPMALSWGLTSTKENHPAIVAGVFDSFLKKGFG
jgi:hypothetical protein